MESNKKDNLGGIIARLRQMLRHQEPMTQIQCDLVALESFGLCRTEGLDEFIGSEAWMIPLVPEAMARHGCPQLAAALEKVRLLFPPGAASDPPRDWFNHVFGVVHAQRDQVIALDTQIEAIDEDHETAVDVIYRDRRSELPEPLQLIPGYWGINPFSGEKKYFRPRYPK